MRSLRWFALSVLCSILFCAGAIAQQAAPAARIVNPIDEQQLVTLKGTVHPLANARNDRGTAPDDMQLDRLHLVLKRSGSQEAALRSLIADLHTPGTASYHKWLTPDAFGKQFGPVDEDITSVENWLSGHGFTVAKVNPGKQTIEFSGNVRQFRSAFHAQIHKYQVNGETHFANSSDPQIPAALAPVVGGFVTLNNFRTKSYAKYMGKAQYDPKTDHATPEWTTGSSTTGYNFVLAPQDYAVQYDLTPLYTAGTNGTGQTIAIINESNINIGLVNTFRSLFSLPANPPQVIIDGNDPGVDGINNPDGHNGASTEAYLDVEWAGAVAPNATIDLVIAGDTALESGLFLAMEHAVYSNVAPVMSLSFGYCESALGATTDAFINGLWEQAAAQGITVMVSTGDSGSAGCDDDDSQEYAVGGLAVSGYASTPYNVAVGGTDFYYSDYSQGLTALNGQFSDYWSTTPSNSTPAVSIKGVIPEQPWNDSQYGLTLATLEQGTTPSSTSIAAGSGGSSSIYTTKPAWQTGFGDTARDIPDISLFASNGVNASFYPICAVDGDCQPASSGGTVQISGVGGTSASSPSFAGIMALVNQKYGRQGQADFVLYPLSKQFPSAFHDVANGTNSVPCAFSATVADDSLNCIAATNPITITVTDSSGNSESILEGQIGAGTTADYNAVAGYDEASGLGTIDANVLVTNWGSVTFASTTTTLTPSETSFTHGTAITISGTVKPASGTATGDVALMTSSTEESQQGQGFYSLSGGAFSGSTDTLPGGTYNIWGQYSGDTSNAESSSTPISITVTPENSEINFALRGASGGTYTATAPPTNVAYGTQLNVSAKVEPAADFTALQNCAGSTTVTCPTFTMPTGTVAFSDNSTALNTAMINAEGDAEYNAPFSVGPHSVTASYAGDNSYNSSTASAIAFTVVKDTPNVYGGASNQTSSGAYVAGQATVFNVLIENGSQSSASSAFSVPVAAPTGTVTVTGFPSGVPTSATLSAGVDPSTLAVAGIATITVPATSLGGTYTVSISYPGDSNYNSASGSGTIQIQSFGGTATTTTATSAGSVSPTSSILVTGTVTGTGTTAPTGGVLVYSSGNYLTQIGFSSTSGDVANFSVALNSQLLSQGANFVTLQYTGDSTYAPSAYTLNTGNSISNPLADFTLIPETTIVPIDVSSGASSGTDVINLGAINGFSGAVNLSCTASPGVNCSITPNAPSLSGGSSTATLTVSATPGSPSLTYDVLVTGADAATGNYVHTLGISAAVTGSTVTTSFGLTPSPSNLSLAAGATSGDTSTITVTPIGAYSSTVDLACSVSGPSGATSPATCSLAASSVASASGSDVVTVATTDTTSAGMYTVTVTGTSGTIAQTTSLNVTVSAPAPGTYNVTATLPASISAGGTANSTITVASTSNYDGTITVTCALTASPTGATDVPTCSAGAGTITLSSSTTTGTTTVTVTTTAATSSELVYPKLGGKGWVGAGGGAVLALLVLLWIPARRRNLLSMLGLVILFAALGSMAACGGGGGSSGGGGGGGSPGTTAGSYTFTVTATGSPAQTSGNTTTFTVSVN